MRFLFLFLLFYSINGSTISPSLLPTLNPTVYQPLNPSIMFSFPQGQCPGGVYTEEMHSLLTITRTDLCPSRNGYPNAARGYTFNNNPALLSATGTAAQTGDISSVFSSYGTSMTIFMWLTPTHAMYNPGTVVNANILAISIPTPQDQLSSTAASNYDLLIQTQGSNNFIVFINGFYGSTQYLVSSSSAGCNAPYVNSVADMLTPNNNNSFGVVVQYVSGTILLTIYNQLTSVTTQCIIGTTTASSNFNPPAGHILRIGLWEKETITQAYPGEMNYLAFHPILLNTTTLAAMFAKGKPNSRPVLQQPVSKPGAAFNLNSNYYDNDGDNVTVVPQFTNLFSIPSFAITSTQQTISNTAGIQTVQLHDACITNCNYQNYNVSVYASPSVSPTSLPTLSPTKLPTSSPTTPTTHLPTIPPTTRPTNLPTLFPTTIPTSLPTTSPTPPTPPTSLPTLSPTKLPTIAPTNLPTLSPTKLPTIAPTSLPTLLPSIIPSGSPISSIPTNSPTNSPSNSPSKLPTIIPSGSPISSIPTNSPSNSPSKLPTIIPSGSPISSIPTNSPSNSPSKLPTIIPSGSPISSIPTNSPSNSPSKLPTPLPSNIPSNIPTNKPTNSPTNPTNSPSNSPSKSPNNLPTTLIPTLSPVSSTPTLSPSKSPSKNPTPHTFTSIILFADNFLHQGNFDPNQRCTLRPDLNCVQTAPFFEDYTPLDLNLPIKTQLDDLISPNWVSLSNITSVLERAFWYGGDHNCTNWSTIISDCRGGNVVLPSNISIVYRNYCYTEYALVCVCLI
jgi:hypothetical protein